MATVPGPPLVKTGTIGQRDHGKTTLTAAITKVLADAGGAEYRSYEDIDDAPGEQALGVFVKMSCVEYATESRRYYHTDCPAHADYIKSMIYGHSPDGWLHPGGGGHRRPDASDQGAPAPGQADRCGARGGVHQQGRCSAHRNTPVVIGSALCALENRDPDLGMNAVLKLLDALDSHVPLPKIELDKPFLFTIEDAFEISGLGTVMTGLLVRGVVNLKEEAELVGYGCDIKTVITGLEMFRKQIDQAEAGDNLGILLRGVKKDDVKRGMVISKPRSIKAHRKVQAQVYVLTKDEGGMSTPFTCNSIPHMFSLTWSVTCALTLPGDKEMVLPGECTTMTLMLMEPVALEKFQRFALKMRNSTICAGVITDILTTDQ
uniref:Elongation factor Tu, mitochondrial n=1 Tax=Tetraodon nigroviridis TaxID=99883 RepID=H3D237_TETNG